MDAELIYTLVGIVIFIVIAIFVFRSDVTKITQGKEEKRYEILNKYKKEIQDVLILFKDDKELRIAKKSELLKRIS
ncbi:MAG: hypothetical protein J7L21_07945, partial [Sulfurimonas sp.]|nr:hypothetical protein [Sulfurimonas sp.]